jgi:hypothetical protein
MSRTPAVILYDANSKPLAVKDGVAIPADTPALLFAGRDATDVSRDILVEADGTIRVATAPPSAPPGTTEFVLAGDDPLVMGGTDSPDDSDSAVVGNGVNLYVQTIVAGAAGDPSEKGSRIDLLWVEGGGPTEHLIERIYIRGSTLPVTLPDVNKARDGTALTGNGSNTFLRLRRIRLSNADQEVDAVVRGYTQ